MRWHRDMYIYTFPFSLLQRIRNSQHIRAGVSSLSCSRRRKGNRRSEALTDLPSEETGERIPIYTCAVYVCVCVWSDYDFTYESECAVAAVSRKIFFVYNMARNIASILQPDREFIYFYERVLLSRIVFSAFARRRSKSFRFSS